MSLSVEIISILESKMEVMPEDERIKFIDSMLESDFDNAEATLVDADDELVSWTDRVTAVRGFGEIDCYQCHEYFTHIIFSHNGKTMVFKTKENEFFKV